MWKQRRRQVRWLSQFVMVHQALVQMISVCEQIVSNFSFREEQCTKVLLSVATSMKVVKEDWLVVGSAAFQKVSYL